MFNITQLFHNQPTGTTVSLKISGMHCTNCSLTIDDELEDIPGVISSQTSYAKSITTVTFNPDLVTPQALIDGIESLHYHVEGMEST